MVYGLLLFMSCCGRVEFTNNSHVLRIKGGYTHPATVRDTIDFIKHYGPISFKSNIVLNGDFLPPANAVPGLSKLLKRLTYGAVWSGNKIRLYRQGGSMLTSVSNFWPGLVGGQTFPWMAAVGDVPVWTQSGLVYKSWLKKSGFLTNSHLPMIKQESNVALIVYKPYRPMPLALWGNVALYWDDDRYDEIRTVEIGEAGISSDSNRGILVTVLGSALDKLVNLVYGRGYQTASWILGRRGDSYVAVYRPCGGDMENGWYACSGVSGRQVWATVVGDASRYDSFDGFANIIASASVSESYQWRFALKPRYITSVTVEATTVHNEW